MKKLFTFALAMTALSASVMTQAQETFPRKFLIEQFTSEACVFCPAGMEDIAEVVEGDEQYIWVSHHAGYMPDEYTIPANGEMARFLGVGGAPSMVLNRTEQKVPNVGTTLVFNPIGFQNVNVTDEKTAPASVVVKPTYDAEKHELTVEVSGQVSDATDNLLLSVMIVENGLIGEQADAYAPGGGWEEYQHTRVVRKMLSASLGDEVPVADKTYSKTYTTTLQEKWNAEKCMVVAYITKAENGIQPIINAEQAPVVEGTTGGNELMPEGIKPYPIEEGSPKTDIVCDDIAMGYWGNVVPNSWMLQILDTKHTIRVNGYPCQAMFQLLLMNEDPKQLKNGIYEINNSRKEGTAVQGYFDEELGYCDASVLYYVYPNGQNLSIVKQWMMKSGTVEITDEYIKINAISENGSEISGTYGVGTAIDKVEADQKAAEKFIHKGQLYIQRGNTIYTPDGTRVK